MALVITIETRLQKSLNQELIGYIDKYIGEYNSICRYVWKVLNGPPSLLTKSKSKLNTHLQGRFGISKRTAGSIIYDVKGKRTALKELKKYELKQLCRKISQFEYKKQQYKMLIDSLKQQCKDGTISPKALNSYKYKRKKYFHLSMKLNKSIQKRDNLKTQICNDRFPLCFGTKKLFSAQHFLAENGFKSHSAWKRTFIQARDRNICFVGSKDESAGNQEFQLIYCPLSNTFQIKIRKQQCHNNADKYIYGTCDFSYMKESLVQILLARRGSDPSQWQPISYRVKRRGRKYYLQAIFELKELNFVPETNYFNGVFGLDFNETFIEVSETNKYGHMVSQKRYDLPEKCNANKSLTKMREVSSQICKAARLVGKDVVIEDLGFSKAKAKMIRATSRNGKRYNRMLSSLDYSRYRKCLESACFRHKVGLIMVNPAYSSKNGHTLYRASMKLSTHQAASFVIAHRGQQLPD